MKYVATLKTNKWLRCFLIVYVLSIDAQVSNDDEENMIYQIADKSEPYNIQFLNIYLKSLMEKHLNKNEYEALRLSYGLDCDPHSAIQIAEKLGINGTSSYVKSI